MKHATNHNLNLYKWLIRMRTFLISCLCVPLLTGCWDAREVEHLFYVHAIGIDYEGGNYVVYAQVINPFAIAKESAKSQELTGAWIGKGVGASVERALTDLYATTQRNVYWGHLDTIILSEPLLKQQQGLQQGVDIITRYPETRYTPWIFGTNSPVSKVLLAKPILESSPVYSLLGDPANVYKQSSLVQPMRLHQFIIAQQEPGRPDLLPELSVAEGKWFDDKRSFEEPEISGFALLQDGTLIGRLSRDEVTGMRWFLPRVPRAIVPVRQQGKTIATVYLSSKRNHIQPVVMGDHVRFNVNVNVRGTVGQMGQPISEGELKSMVAQEIKQDIRKTYDNGLRFGFDTYGLSDSLYRRNPQAFHHFADKNEHLKLSEDSLQDIRVNVRLYDSGRTTEPSTRFTSQSSRS